MFSSNLQLIIVFLKKKKKKLIIVTIENTINNLIHNWLTDSCFFKKKKYFDSFKNFHIVVG